MKPLHMKLSKASSISSHSASWLFSLGTLLSRITGFLREMMLARIFGGSVILDAFYVAYRIPHLLRDLLAEGALGSSLTKNYAQAHEHSPHHATHLAMGTLIVIFAVTSVLTALGILFCEPLVSIMTMYGDQDHHTLRHTAESLTAWLFPLMAFSALASVFSGILAHQRRFLLISLSPVLCNLGTLVGLLMIGPWLTAQLSQPIFGLSGLVFGLAIGTLAGGLLQLLALAMPNFTNLWRHRNHLSIHSLFNLKSSHFRVFKESLPMVIAGGVAQLQIIIATNFATSLSAGTVSWLHLSFRLFQLPVGLFAVAKATVILPTLAAHLSTHSSLDSRKLTQELGSLLWIMGFCMCVTLITGTHIVELIYHSGAFSAYDTAMTAAALKAYSWGMMGYALMKVLLSYYYAAEKTHWVLWLAIATLILSTTSHVLWLDMYGHVGMAAVTSITLSIQAAILIGLIYYKQPKQEWRYLTHCFIFALLAGTLAHLSIMIIELSLPSPFHHMWFNDSHESILQFKLKAAVTIITKSAIILAVFVTLYRLTQRTFNLTTASFQPSQPK